MFKVNKIITSVVLLSAGVLLGVILSSDSFVKAATEFWGESGSNIINLNTGKVVIGTATGGNKLDVQGTGDASGLSNSGILEVGNSLRLDGNELITNSNTALLLQYGNNGDLRVDNITFSVDSSANRVGIGDSSPSSPLHVYQNDTAIFGNSGLTLEQDGTGDTKTQYYLTGGNRWTTGIDNSDGDKFKIGLGSNWTSEYIVLETDGDICIGNCN